MSKIRSGDDVNKLSLMKEMVESDYGQRGPIPMGDGGSPNRGYQELSIPFGSPVTLDVPDEAVFAIVQVTAGGGQVNKEVVVRYKESSAGISSNSAGLSLADNEKFKVAGRDNLLNIDFSAVENITGTLIRVQYYSTLIE